MQGGRGLTAGERICYDKEKLAPFFCVKTAKKRGSEGGLLYDGIDPPV